MTEGKRDAECAVLCGAVLYLQFPVVSQLSNTFSKFHYDMHSPPDSGAVSNLLKKKSRLCNRRNLLCSFNHFSIRENGSSDTYIVSSWFFSLLFQIVSQITFYISFWWVFLFSRKPVSAS